MRSEASPERPSAAFRFCFTLDTEPDDLWANAPINSFEHFSKLQEFHKALVEAGARPTYLTTSEVAEDPRARRFMQAIVSQGNAEIGAHFHTWTRRWPFDVPDLGFKPLHACAHRLGQRIEEQMLEYTSCALEAAFGARPISYRGGRWSLNGESLTSLRNCGIKVDTTVTPGISWADERHLWLSAPDFRLACRMPYYMADESIEPRQTGDILELPVGASFIPNREIALSADMWDKVKRRLCKAMGRPSGLVWLRPTGQSRAEMRECLRLLHRDGVPVWVAMIHSSEIVPCKKFRSEAEVQRFRERCILLVRDAIELGASGATLEEALRHCDALPQLRGAC